MRALKLLAFPALALIALAGDPQVGPVRGTLVAAGGGRLGPEIIERFIELAGGRDSAFVIIPTAGAGDHPEAANSFLSRIGCRDVTVLHTTDRAVADTEDFVQPLKRARGVWVHGGQEWRLVDSYLNTRTHRELLAVLDRGGVIGGSSAGASIQASYLVRGARDGPSVMMAPGYEQGFGFLRGAGVDQHLITRHRENDMLQVIDRHPEILGIGIDEETAIVIEGDRMEVIGKSKVAIYDPQRAANGSERYFFLFPGETFHLQTRQRLR
jgi:cyanophycinase